MHLVDPHEFLRSLCVALGLDPDARPIHCITVTARAGQPPRVMIEEFLRDRSQSAPAVHVNSRDLTADEADQFFRIMTRTTND